MNEEEKEAIKTIKSFKNMKWYNHAFDKGVEILTEEERREIDIIINLIEKQQEQIEELRETCNKYNDMKYFVIAADRYISKDKIRELMKDYQEGDMVEIIGVCKFLLGE